MLKKMDIHNKRILRVILKDYNSPYGDLLDKINLKPLHIRRLQIFQFYYIRVPFSITFQDI